MQLYLPNVPQSHFIIFDVEYDGANLVQLGLLKFGCVEPHIFELRQSLNLYIKQRQPLSIFFQSYTGISDSFVQENGITLKEAAELVKMLIGDSCPLIISHGVKCDLHILKQNGIDLTSYPSYCTYEHSKAFSQQLTLAEVAVMDGFYLFNEHNAYADAWGTLHAFCYLQQKEKKI